MHFCDLNIIWLFLFIRPNINYKYNYKSGVYTPTLATWAGLKMVQAELNYVSIRPAGNL